MLASLQGAGGDAPDEILVVDGGSRDRTREIAREHGARVVTSPPGRGLQLARGAREAHGELLFFPHADTYLAAGALGLLRAAFRSPELLAAGLQQRIDAEGRLYRWIEKAANARTRRGWIYGDSGLCCRRSAYEAAGGFRPLELFEDLDLSRRLKRVGSSGARGSMETSGGTIGLVENAELRISARRWQREGIARRSVKNWILTAAFLLGVHPARLVRYYRSESQVAADA